MTVKDRISTAIEEALRPEALEVIDESHLHAGHSGSRDGGETHFRVRVTSGAFVGKSRVDRHRTINALLAGEFVPGGVHALAIEARAPGEGGGEAPPSGSVWPGPSGPSAPLPQIENSRLRDSSDETPP